MDTKLYAKAILNLLGNNVGFTLSGTDYTTLFINGSTKKPTEEAINKEYLALVFTESLEDLRAKRNKLLFNCDWTDLPNAPLTEAKKTEWQIYRQQLRDLTNGITTAEQAKAVIFPNEVK